MNSSNEYNINESLFLCAPSGIKQSPIAVVVIVVVVSGGYNDDYRIIIYKQNVIK